MRKIGEAWDDYSGDKGSMGLSIFGQGSWQIRVR